MSFLKWTEELGKELVALIKGLSKEKQEKKENMESAKKKTLTIQFSIITVPSSDLSPCSIFFIFVPCSELLLLFSYGTNSNKDSISQTTLKNTYTSTQKAQNKQENL